MIESGDSSTLKNTYPQKPQSFSDEMISIALVELSNNRVRSAILHSVIALESAAKGILRKILNGQFLDIEEGSILEAISRETSLVTLARVVFLKFVGKKEAKGNTIDWEKIKDLYNVRNTIVHRGQRRLPTFEITRDQLLEVFKYIQIVENALHNGLAEREGD